MGSDNQLRARVPNSHADLIEQVSKDRGIQETDAERIVVRNGLAAMGYVETPTAPSEQLLTYARRGGNVLGLVGLIFIGYGLFGAAAFRFIGFGLVLAGFGMIAGAEFGPAVKARFGANSQEVAA
jgi:hypothetical protein